MKKILAVIPARGGSKRLPKKNVRKMNGKPLIAWTIEAALKSRYLNRVIVSTDNKEISSISKKYGAEVIKRPRVLATDRAKVIDVVFNLLDFLKKDNYCPDIIVMLQATTPLRKTEHINEAIKIFLRSECEALVSFTEPEQPIHWSFVKKGKYVHPVFGWKGMKTRSQDFSKVYCPNGAIYIIRPETFRKYKGFYPRQIIPYIMPKDESIDIDTETEFKLAEFLMKKI